MYVSMDEHRMPYVSIGHRSRRRLSMRVAMYALLSVVICALTVAILVRKWAPLPGRAGGEGSTPKADGLDALASRAHEQAARDGASRPAEAAAGLVPFHATAEWQVVPNDAVLPDGLDISMDFQTGIKRARLHAGPPGGASESRGAAAHQAPPATASRQGGPHQEAGGAGLVALPQQGAAAAQQPKRRTLIEERLDEILSKDKAVQRRALDYLDVQSHTMQIGEAIARAENFDNLTGLLASPLLDLRTASSDIIAACLHNNVGAAAALLGRGGESSFVAKVVARLTAEPDANVRRRMVAILTYGAQMELEQTMAQFVASNGFVALAGVNDRKKPAIDAPFFEREMVLLATLGRTSNAEYERTALAFLDGNIARLPAKFNEVSIDAFRPICANQVGLSPYANLAAFCTSNALR